MTTPILPPLESGIYQGFVRHRRFHPVRHEFRYPLFMVFIRLDELTRLQRSLFLFGTRIWHWARFRRQDYLASSESSLASAVRARIASDQGLSPTDLTGAVYFFGHLRYLGFYFSPLNLYFLEHHGRLRYMLAEVSNTPWNQRHYYSVDLDNLEPHDKEFHVSPFNPMTQTYQWRIRPPDAMADKSMVHLGVQNRNSVEPLFDATMVLKRRRMNQSNLLRVLISTPVQTLSMVAGIYWQALKLYLKGVPFHSHPERDKRDLKTSR
ncbi:MAG: DUF1365 domain-containing protein [Gammaproteobacteria bacterium]|nr:DUF1365 domain-containing protein [Pseudomonadales bacterium]MCP5346158.1 DUF1365 domain-containing protein [Pseudomonadales bacterium]